MLGVHQPHPIRLVLAAPFKTVLAFAIPALLILISSSPGIAQAGYDDHQNMMDQLGIKAIRGGPNPNNQATFDEAKANPYKDSMPDALRMKDGTKVTKAKQWPKRRAEIAEDFEREVVWPHSSQRAESDLGGNFHDTGRRQRRTDCYQNACRPCG